MTGLLVKLKLEKMDMLRNVIKKFGLFIIVLFFCSCKAPVQENGIYTDRYQEYLTDNFDSYRGTYNSINDSISVWVTDSLAKILPLMHNTWQLDSAIVFNADSSRLFTTVNERSSGWKNTKLDWIHEFAGAYLEGEWYYYFMPTSMPVSRMEYKDGLYEPYTFDELSYIAHKRSFGGMLKRAKDGSIILNEKSFNKKHFDLRNGKSYKIEKEYRDSQLLKSKYDKNYRVKLKAGIADEIKAEMEARVKPLEPITKTKEKSKKNKKFGEKEEVKLFESEDWKNRRKK